MEVRGKGLLFVSCTELQLTDERRDAYPIIIWELPKQYTVKPEYNLFVRRSNNNNNKNNDNFSNTVVVVVVVQNGKAVLSQIM